MHIAHIRALSHHMYCTYRYICKPVHEEIMCEYIVNINISLKQNQKNLISFHIISSSQLIYTYITTTSWVFSPPPPVFSSVFHMSHPSLQARQSHLWKQWVVAHCLDPATGINQNSWTVQANDFLIAPIVLLSPKIPPIITPPGDGPCKWWLIYVKGLPFDVGSVAFFFPTGQTGICELKGTKRKNSNIENDDRIVYLDGF